MFCNPCRAVPPREPVVNSSLTILEGSTLVLHCSTQGSPAPTLTWLKDGELVGTIVADELSVLEITEVTPQGAGQYRCLAENEHGRASSSLNVTVECESDVPPPCNTPTLLYPYCSSTLLYPHPAIPPLCFTPSLLYTPKRTSVKGLGLGSGVR